MSETPTNDQELSLERARSLFDAGNYKAARDIAERLQTSEDNAERKGAEALLAQLSPSPVTKYLLLLTAVLLVCVTAFAYLHQQ